MTLAYRSCLLDLFLSTKKKKKQLTSIVPLILEDKGGSYRLIGRSTREQICCNVAIETNTSVVCCKAWPFPSCTRAQLISCWHFLLFSCVAGASAALAERSPFFRQGEAAACRLALRFIKAEHSQQTCLLVSSWCGKEQRSNSINVEPFRSRVIAQIYHQVPFPIRSVSEVTFFQDQDCSLFFHSSAN